MGVFDALIIQTPGGKPDRATGLLEPATEIARPEGPLEHGHFDDTGTWIPAGDPEQLDLEHFGIDSLGRPYYDTAGAAPGEEAIVWIDPNAAPSLSIWLVPA